MSDDKTFTFGPLYDQLRLDFPDYVTPNGRFDVPRFAAEIDMSAEGIYKWLRSNRLRPANVARILALSGGRADREDYIQFVFA